MIILIFLIKIKTTFKIFNSFLLSTFLCGKIKLEDEIFANLLPQLGLLAHFLNLCL